ncbi:NAD(P)/FAD-dependent oxidoreductase [Syntrophomonas erecta subsp. sporosyntropha]
MKLRIRGIRLPLDYEEQDLIQAAARRVGLKAADLKSLVKVKKAVDARRRQVVFTYTVDVELADDAKLVQDKLDSPEITVIVPRDNLVLVPGQQSLPHSPVIVGSGPAGLFCALLLARHGYCPVIIERGEDVDRRIEKVETFWQQGILDSSSNTQFGEGGAGTFSDGKLTTRIGDLRINYVLKTFVDHGADEEILYLKKPHVGTDVIRKVVKNIRQEILDRGGQVYFKACLTDISINQTYLESIIINNQVELDCSVLVLAVGHSARDLYRLLEKKGVTLTPKAFAVGVRAEHPQDFIDQTQYGDYASHPRLGAADYHLTYQDRARGRSLYTFCMCPGGYVIGAASSPGQVVTNGMSFRARNSGIANSALVVTVDPRDWNYTPLGGMDFQEKLEYRAFAMGGDNYQAPAQKMVDFLNRTRSQDLKGSIATFKPGVVPVNLWDLLPREICQVLEQGLRYWNRKMQGFIHNQAVLTGVETRTSAPLRIERSTELNSLNVKNLYPCGEGAGYAGGIISAAVDGLRVAEQVVQTYRKPEGIIQLDDPTIINARTL